MSVQKQRGETRTPSTDTSGQHGNASAKIAADKAVEILAKPLVEEKTATAIPLELFQTTSYPSLLWDNSRTAIDTAMFFQADYQNNMVIMRPIETNGEKQDGMICQCLSPICYIGPFIPIRS